MHYSKHAQFPCFYIYLIMATIQDRIVAKEFAASVIKSLNPPEADAPYLEGVIVEAVLFEIPMKDLQIGLNQVGSFYNLTIKGYENLIDIVRWANTFMGLNRNPLLCHVTHSFIQLTEKGAIMVIQMNKIEFHTSSNADLVAEENPTISKKNGIPRQFKKRTH